MHAEHLESTYGVGPHAVSIPRIRKADGINPDDFEHAIDDKTFEKIVACIRIALPYTGMIVSTRESRSVREKVLELGVSQISGGSKTSVGGYTHSDEETESSAQFDVTDTRTLDDIVHWLMNLGHMPSFCTACYRAGRTGEDFMKICKEKQIHNFCSPNAIITLKEYLEDYATTPTKEKGQLILEEEINKIENDKIRELVKDYLTKIEHGERDFRL
jgi:2-iminoacetate synthase